MTRSSIGSSMIGGLLHRAGLASLAASLCLLPAPADAQQRSIPIVRDTEIEALIRDYSRPILEAANLSRSGVEIILVNENSFNAFVARSAHVQFTRARSRPPRRPTRSSG